MDWEEGLIFQILFLLPENSCFSESPVTIDGSAQFLPNMIEDIPYI
jgi:hypothetical protein